jgi:hypothetical protein
MKILSIQTKKLSPDKINKIINLKATHYKFKKKLQLLWFNNNIKKTDIHNILIHNNEIIGYNCLRKIKLLKVVSKKKKTINSNLFDTHIIKEKYRKKNLSKFIMKRSNLIIKKKNIFSFLICSRSMTKYYKKFNWKLFPKNKIKFSKNNDFIGKRCMIFKDNIKNFAEVKYEILNH